MDRFGRRVVEAWGSAGGWNRRGEKHSYSILDDAPVLGDLTVRKRNSGGQESHPPLARDQHTDALGDL